MKRIILLLCIALSSSLVMKAQDYERVICPQCGGNCKVFSGYYDVYGYPIMMPCPKCMGYGFILVPYSQNVSFKSGKNVQLKDKTGGITYAHGTYYPIENTVVLKDGTKLLVTNSDIRGYDRMIKFSDGTKWYFQY